MQLLPFETRRLLQCSSKKCTRAFHASCALSAGVQIDAGMVPTFGEDGTVFSRGYDFRCKFHRPKQPKNLTVDMLEGSRRLVNHGKELKCNDVLQAQHLGGEVFAGLVVENRPTELCAVADVLPEGYVSPNVIECVYHTLTIFPVTVSRSSTNICAYWIQMILSDLSLRPTPLQCRRV